MFNLRNGKSINTPSFFVNPKTSIDIDILQITNQRYANDGQGGLPNIEGLLIDLCDINTIGINNICTQQVLCGPTLSDKIIIINPALDILFHGIESKKNRYFTMRNSPFRNLERVLTDIVSIEDKISSVYPLLDINFIRESLIFLLQNRTDVCVYPTVPLTSSRFFEEQFAQLEYMVRMSNHLMDTLIDPDQRIDRMILITLNPRLINQDTANLITNLMSNYDVEHIGIKLTETPENDISKLRSFVNLLDSIHEIINQKEKKPLFQLWNTREMGYMAWCHGVDVITNPIAGFPYFREFSSSSPPDQKMGRYYHPAKKIDIEYDSLMEDTRHRNYQLPCYCLACQNALSILRATNESSSTWNTFRKTHFLLTKNQEVNILKNTDISLRRAVHSFFADNQCENTIYLPFLT